MLNFDEVLAGDVSIQRLSAFERFMDSAADQDVLPETISIDSLPPGNAAVASQLRSVVVHRLYRLGYLRKDRNITDQQLTQAVRKMQQEAALLKDGWVGAITWQALQEVFTFEEPTNLRKWLALGEHNPFLCRAVNLRLNVMGITRNANRQANAKDFSDSFKHWRDILKRLDVPTLGAKWSRSNLLSWLFNLDGLTTFVNRNPQKVKRAVKTRNKRSPRYKRLMRFLASLLKIELWLNGYEQIKPSDNVSTLEKETNYKLNGAIKALWKDIEQAKQDDQGAAVVLGNPNRYSGIDRLLICFRHIADWENYAGHLEAENRSKIVKNMFDELGDLEQNSNEKVASVTSKWSDVGWFSWVLDGLKRIWNVFKKFIRRLSKAIVYLTRGLKQIVSQSFFYLSRTFHMFSQTVTYLFDYTVRGSNQRIAARRNIGFDFDVFIATKTKQTEVAAFFRNWSTQHGYFRATMIVLRLLLKAISGAAKFAAGPVLWWRGILTLLSLYRSIDEQDILILTNAYK